MILSLLIKWILLLPDVFLSASMESLNESLETPDSLCCSLNTRAADLICGQNWGYLAADVKEHGTDSMGPWNNMPTSKFTVNLVHKWEVNHREERVEFLHSIRGRFIKGAMFLSWSNIDLSWLSVGIQHFSKVQPQKTAKTIQILPKTRP